MPQQEYKKLAVHNSVCNHVYFKFQDCLREHPFAKWVGKCTNFGTELEECIKQNREVMREKNLRLAKKRFEKMKAGDYSEHTNKV